MIEICSSVGLVVLLVGLGVIHHGQPGVAGYLYTLPGLTWWASQGVNIAQIIPSWKVHHTQRRINGWQRFRHFPVRHLYIFAPQ